MNFTRLFIIVIAFFALEVTSSAQSIGQVTTFTAFGSDIALDYSQAGVLSVQTPSVPIPLGAVGLAIISTETNPVTYSINGDVDTLIPDLASAYCCEFGIFNGRVLYDPQVDSIPTSLVGFDIYVQVAYWDAISQEIRSTQCLELQITN